MLALENWTLNFQRRISQINPLIIVTSCLFVFFNGLYTAFKDPRDQPSEHVVSLLPSTTTTTVRQPARKNDTCFFGTAISPQQNRPQPSPQTFPAEESQGNLAIRLEKAKIDAYSLIIHVQASFNKRRFTSWR